MSAMTLNQEKGGEDMSYSYRGVRATWNYYKHCWVIPINGVCHYCYDDEVEDTIDELLGK